jgi:hypothetical protein
VPEVKYNVSTYLSKFAGYQSKKGKNGKVKIFISKIWRWAKEDFSTFWKRMIFIILIERICLERAFNNIRIEGGMCNPCCVKNAAKEMYFFCLENL